MGAVSQWEREAIGERTRDAWRHKRSNGERVGNIEFGYRLSPDGRHLEPDSTEQAALTEIRNLRRQGHSLRGIAATTDTARAVGRTGGWNQWLESQSITLWPCTRKSPKPVGAHLQAVLPSLGVLRPPAKPAAAPLAFAAPATTPA